MRKSKRSSLRSIAGKKEHKKRERKGALRDAGMALAGQLPGMGTVMAVKSLGEAYNRFRNNL